MKRNSCSSPEPVRLDDLPDVITRRQAAAALGVSIATVRTYESAGYLHPLDLPGDRVLIPKHQILAVIAAANARCRPLQDDE